MELLSHSLDLLVHCCVTAGGEGRNRAANVLLTAKTDRFFRLIKYYSATTQNYTLTTPLLTLPLTVDLLTSARTVDLLTSARTVDLLTSARTVDLLTSARTVDLLTSARILGIQNIPVPTS